MDLDKMTAIGNIHHICLHIFDPQLRNYRDLSRYLRDFYESLKPCEFTYEDLCDYFGVEVDSEEKD